MTALIVFLLILVVIGGFVAFIVWKVLKAPIAPPAPTSTEPLAPAAEAEPLATEPLFQPKPAELVNQRIRLKRPEIPVEKNDHRTAKRVALVAGAAAVLPPAFVAIGALAVLTRPKARLSGGDDDLGWKPGSTQGKGKDVPELHVSVFASGRIEVEGQDSTVPQLETRLADLKSQRGKVRLYCEPAEPRPVQASEVLGVLIRLEIPFTSTGKPDTRDSGSAALAPDSLDKKMGQTEGLIWQAGTKVFVGRPAKPMEPSLVKAITELLAEIPGVMEAHLPQVFAKGVVEPSSKVLVVVIDPSFKSETVVLTITEGLGKILPTATHLDVVPMADGDPLLQAVRSTRCALKSTATP